MKSFLKSLFKALVLWGCPLPPSQYGVLVACCWFFLPDPGACLHPCLAVLYCCAGQRGAALCEAISLQCGNTAWERDVNFPSMPLCASSVPLRASPKFSSLVDSERMPIIGVHHYCDLYVVVVSNDKLNISCAFFIFSFLLLYYFRLFCFLVRELL